MQCRKSQLLTELREVKTYWTRKPCCRKETARCRKCSFPLKFANNIHYLLTCTCTWCWWAQQQKLSCAHIWPELVESFLEWIRWLCFDHVLWQRVPTITDSDTEECFPDGFDTSWDVNFHRMSSQIVYFWSHLEKQLAINTFLPCQDLIRFN